MSRPGTDVYTHVNECRDEIVAAQQRIANAAAMIYDEHEAVMAGEMDPVTAYQAVGWIDPDELEQQRRDAIDLAEGVLDEYGPGTDLYTDVSLGLEKDHVHRVSNWEQTLRTVIPRTVAELRDYDLDAADTALAMIEDEAGVDGGYGSVEQQPVVR